VKILLAEDEPHLREGIASGSCAEAGHEVLGAPRTAMKPRARLEQGGIFDLLLTDIKMPGRDGIEVPSGAPGASTRRPSRW
jgi:YesN/AraC family two-component response regulator